MLGFIKGLFKESVVALYQFYLRCMFKSSKSDGSVKSLSSEGVCLPPIRLSTEKCGQLRSVIDSRIDNDEALVWRDEEGADERIYFINSIEPVFQELFNDSYTLSVLKRYTGITDPKGFVLAARLAAVEGNVGSGGGWHRDSPYRHQFKSIYYLSDVCSENGPFQFIKGSHSFLSSFFMYVKTSIRWGEYRYTEEQVTDIGDTLGQNPEEMLGGAGTCLFADTKIVHRGKPITAGKRYAVFCYYFDKEIPPHFDVYRQEVD